jgi:hypothetical protein
MKSVFAAVHESGYGTKRRNQILQIHVRFRGTAEVDRHPSLTASDAIDPLRTSATGGWPVRSLAHAKPIFSLGASRYDDLLCEGSG